MAYYVRFQTAADEFVLVEIEPTTVMEDEGSPLVSKGPVQAGISDRAKDVVINAQRKLDEAWDVAYHNIKSFLTRIQELTAEQLEKPDEIELSFGLKATSAGNMAVAKAGIEASYNVKLVWKEENK